MPTTDLLKQFGLRRNPYTDRTAEKTHLDGLSMYIHSDLQGFAPSGIFQISLFRELGHSKSLLRRSILRLP